MILIKITSSLELSDISKTNQISFLKEHQLKTHFLETNMPCYYQNLPIPLQFPFIKSDVTWFISPQILSANSSSHLENFLNAIQQYCPKSVCTIEYTYTDIIVCIN